MPTQKKIDSVQKLAEKLGKAKAVIFTNYQGLTNRQIEDLKKSLKETEADFKVAKNTLLKLALEKTRLPNVAELTDNLSGPTALLLPYQDEILPLKKLALFIKQFQLPTLKVGILLGRVLKGEELLAITTLPPKDVLQASLVWQISSPLHRLMRALTFNTQKLVLTLSAVQKQKLQ